MTRLTDQKLLKKLAAGNVRAFEQLVKNYHAKVFLFTRKLIGTDVLAEDLTQEIFTTIWERREQLGSILSLDNYLFILARNKALNLLKEQAARHNREKSYAHRFEQQVNEEDRIHLNDYQRFVGKLAGRLPDRRREIFKLKVEEGLSNDEIQKRLKISMQTVKNQLSKAYISIRESLTEHLAK